MKPGLGVPAGCEQGRVVFLQAQGKLPGLLLMFLLQLHWYWRW